MTAAMIGCQKLSAISRAARRSCPDQLHGRIQGQRNQQDESKHLQRMQNGGTENTVVVTMTVRAHLLMMQLLRTSCFPAAQQVHQQADHNGVRHLNAEQYQHRPRMLRMRQQDRQRFVRSGKKYRDQGAGGDDPPA